MSLGRLSSATSGLLVQSARKLHFSASTATMRSVVTAATSAAPELVPTPGTMKASLMNSLVVLYSFLSETCIAAKPQQSLP